MAESLPPLLPESSGVISLPPVRGSDTNLGNLSGKAPSWETIKKSLVSRGLMTNGGDSRRARARTCEKCGAPVMSGLDHERSALLAVCDPAPINAKGEALALVIGRETYSLRFITGKYSLDRRDSWQISGAPAGSDPKVEVLVSHVCNSPLPPELHEFQNYAETYKPIAKEESEDAPY